MVTFQNINLLQTDNQKNVLQNNQFNLLQTNNFLQNNINLQNNPFSGFINSNLILPNQNFGQNIATNRGSSSSTDSGLEIQLQKQKLLQTPKKQQQQPFFTNLPKLTSQQPKKQQNKPVS